MALWVGIVGCVLLFVVTVDSMWTTLYWSRSGPITHIVLRFNLLLAELCHSTLHMGRTVMAIIGVLALVGVMLTWQALVWTAWTMVYTIDPNGVESSLTGAPATTVDLIYFVGYSLYTLGLGDFHPVTPGYQIMTALCNAHGFFLFSMYVTYILQVVQAFIAVRHGAIQVALFGRTPEDILKSAFDGSSFKEMDRWLYTLASSTAYVAQTFLQYPVLFNLTCTDPDTSIPLKVAVFDEALNMIEFGVHPSVRPHPLALISARRSVSHFLRAVSHIYVKPKSKKTAPPLPLFPPTLALSATEKSLVGDFAGLPYVPVVSPLQSSGVGAQIHDAIIRSRQPSVDGGQRPAKNRYSLCSPSAVFQVGVGATGANGAVHHPEEERLAPDDVTVKEGRVTCRVVRDFTPGDFFMSPEVFKLQMERSDVMERRKILEAMVKAAGWEWRHVNTPP